MSTSVRSTRTIAPIVPIVPNDTFVLPFKCRIAWHAWSKWAEIEIYLISMKTGHRTEETIDRQERVCLRCDKRQRTGFRADGR